MKKIAAIVRSDKFFYAILILFILQASWIAISATYPQPFDENTHFGLIKLYSQHWSPFLTDQPPNADALGAVARDPSYLYHYLMSFPYRVFAHFVHSLPAQVIFLRFLNVAFFAASLVVFRKVLQKTKATPGIINCVFLFFVLIPVVPFLAGQINYDNLLMLTVAATLLLTLNFVEVMDKKKRMNLILGLGALSAAILGSLVKVEFLPIFLVVVVFIIFKIGRFWWMNKVVFIKSLRHKVASAHRGMIVVSLVIFILASGLFLQRYGVNFLRYGTPTPRCDQVLTVEQCSANGSWKRAYDAERTKQTASHSPIRYSVSWVVRMFIYSFYTRSGGNPGAYYVNVNPLPLIGITAIAVFSTGVLIFLFYTRAILREDRALLLLLILSVVYYAVLWAYLFQDYLQTGQKFGINGRYLFPAILPVLLAVGLAYQRLLSKRPLLKPVLLITVFLLFL
ncbi:MAG: hypothetical protein Q8P54_01725, partial [bacterium]|nr:hypothetical protein [bacterium]